MAPYVSAQRALHGAFAKRRICTAGLETTTAKYGGCDDATAETSVEAEACDQSRRTGLGSGRVDLFASGERVRVGCADGRCPADDKFCADSVDHSRRRGDRRRQSGHVPSLRQRERWWQRPGSLARLRRLPRLPRLQSVQSLQVRRLRRLRRLLRNMGVLPLVLNQTGFRLH
jgi:hypothetical protein